MCQWNTKAEECVSWPLWNLRADSKCGKHNGVDTQAGCEAQKDNSGTKCLWRGSPENTCSVNKCENFWSQSLCEAHKAAPHVCLWNSGYCEPTKCNTAGYSDEAACKADAKKVGLCKWDSRYSPKCQPATCSNLGTDEASCDAATSKVKPLTFILGRAPYGNTPCFWKGSCYQIYNCEGYGLKEAACKADKFGFGKCKWDGGKCKDMTSCEKYTDQTSCVSDAYSAASYRHSKAKCWWQDPKTSEVTVGNTVAVPAPYASNGPIATSKNIDIELDGELNIKDGKWMYFGFAVTGEMKKVYASEVKDSTGKVVELSKVPQPVPDGYTIKINGACDDNVPGLAAYATSKIDCGNFKDATACAAPTGSAGPSPGPSPPPSSGTSGTSSSSVTSSAEVHNEVALSVLVGVGVLNFGF